jgi:predicted AAA+ superfamily ATPase
MDEFSIKSGTIVTWDDEASFETNISAVPGWKWLLDEQINQHNPG